MAFLLDQSVRKGNEESQHQLFKHMFFKDMFFKDLFLSRQDRNATGIHLTKHAYTLCIGHVD